ncbi:MAG: PEP-CTERM sorting domain-containing protein [Burkholderiaceae bacterium]
MMKLKRKGVALAVVSVGLAYGGVAQAGYFVLPTVQFAPGAVQNGLDVDGVTSKTLAFNDAARSAASTVDLGTGSLKAYAAADSSNSGAYANAIMGDTITFRGGAGTTWDFGFTVDGTLKADLGPEAPGNQSSTLIGYSIAFAVYRPGQVTWKNWFDKGDDGNAVPVFFDSQNHYFTFPGGDPSQSVLEHIGSSLTLGSDYEVFEIYAKLFAAANSDIPIGLVSSVANFGNTGKVGFNYDDSVTAYSDSGVFLGLARDPNAANDVPEPHTLALVLAGLLGAVGFARRRRA